MRYLILVLALAGCMEARSEPGREELALSRELEGRVAGPPQDCINATPSTSLNIVSRDTLVYRAGATIWVNRIPGGCPGTRPFNQLIVEPSSAGRYCRSDRIRAVETGSSIPGPICPLGQFTPYRAGR